MAIRCRAYLNLFLNLIEESSSAFLKDGNKRADADSAVFWAVAPTPRVWPAIKLCRCHLHRSFNLISIGETLPSQDITTEETPPAFLEVEPTRSLGNEHLL